MIRGLALAIVVPALLLAGPIRAFQQPSFRSGALGVRVDVLVTDGHKAVGGLGAPDFVLRDNGVVQTIEVVDAADVPLNAVLALDASASTTGKRQTDLISASQALLDGLEPRDRAALTTFSHAVAPRIALTSGVPSRRGPRRRRSPESALGTRAALAGTSRRQSTSRAVDCLRL